MKKFITTIITSLLMFFLQDLCAATVYKGVDAQGNTFYSDKPVGNGSTIEVAAPPASPAPSQNALNTDPQTPPPVPPYTLRITQPTNDQTFTTDIETISVKLSIEPALLPQHKIRLFVNAAPYQSLFDSGTITLNRLPRGAYQLQAQIVPEKEITRPIAQSNVVMIYQQRAIKRKPPPPHTP